MSTELLLLLCALHSFGFAAFHLLFWKLFDWPATLQATTLANRAILQIANGCLIYVCIAVGLACLLLPQELRATGLGRAFLLGMSGFWLFRLVLQFVWLRVNRPMVHVLSALFAIGALLFGWAALRG